MTLKESKATGQYSISPYTWDATKWGVYAPEGTLISTHKSRAKADTERVRITKEGL